MVLCSDQSYSETINNHELRTATTSDQYQEECNSATDKRLPDCLHLSKLDKMRRQMKIWHLSKLAKIRTRGRQMIHCLAFSSGQSKFGVLQSPWQYFVPHSPFYPVHPLVQKKQKYFCDISKQIIAFGCLAKGVKRPQSWRANAKCC